MTVKEELITKAKNLMLAIADLKGDLTIVEDNIAEINCPFKIGDKIINKDGIKAAVVNIKSCPSNVLGGYNLIVNKFKKKTGEKYKYTDSVRSWESWVKDE